MLISPRMEKDDDPLVVMLAWLEPGEDVATRLFEAIGKAEELAKDFFRECPALRPRQL